MEHFRACLLTNKISCGCGSDAGGPRPAPWERRPRDRRVSAAWPGHLPMFFSFPPLESVWGYLCHSAGPVLGTPSGPPPPPPPYALPFARVPRVPSCCISRAFAARGSPAQPPPDRSSLGNDNHTHNDACVPDIFHLDNHSAVHVRCTIVCKDRKEYRDECFGKDSGKKKYYSKVMMVRI